MSSVTSITGQVATLVTVGGRSLWRMEETGPRGGTIPLYQLAREGDQVPDSWGFWSRRAKDADGDRCIGHSASRAL